MSRYVISAVASLVLLLSAFSSTAVAVAFPIITDSFQTTLVLAGWVLSAYQLTYTATVAMAGKVADTLGRKFTVVLSLVLFMTGSLFCALAPNLPLLIFARVIQGIGGGGFLPATAGIVADQFPKARPQAIGLISSIFTSGQVIGPVLGGWLTSSYGWRSVFWFNVPFGLVTLLIIVLMLKPEKRQNNSLDVTGAALFAAFISSFLIALSKVGDSQGFIAMATTVSLFGLSFIFMALFARHERRTLNPIIELDLLRKKPFMAANVFNFVFGASTQAVVSVIPLYAVAVLNMSTLESGLVVTPRSIGLIIASAVTSLMLIRWGYRWPILVGTLISAVSLVLISSETIGITTLGAQVSSTVLLSSIMFAYGIGMGVSVPAANNACIELMPDRIATITSIRSTFRMAGGAVGITAATLLLHHSGTINQGFLWFFASASGVMLLVVPLIFLMPKDCRSPGADVTV